MSDWELTGWHDDFRGETKYDLFVPDNVMDIHSIAFIKHEVFRLLAERIANDIYSKIVDKIDQNELVKNAILGAISKLVEDYKE